MSLEISQKPIRVIIAEDQLMMAEGLSAILEKDGTYTVISISPDGQHLLHSLNSIQPDLILLDLNMPVMDGFKACKIIRERFPGLIVVALTMYNNEKILQQVKEAGAAGMLLKYSSSADLLGKLGEILNNEKGKNFVTSDKPGQKADETAFSVADGFLSQFKISPRELEIMHLIAQGLPTEEIAQKLYLSAHTVTTHRKNILNKLNLNNAVELIGFMHKNGML